MKKQAFAAKHFFLCVNNEGYKASLEVGKVYCAIPDQEAATHGYIRVIDESGEDYAYAANRFFPIELPLAAKRALLSASQKQAA